MNLKLSDTEVRVLGCLMEKEMATPEYYPLSLNALVNGCNQKSNRDPVVSYDEKTVLDAIEGLKEKGLGWQSDSGRVSKYSESFIKSRNLVHKEAVILCVLFLRGPQTAGELRERTDRLHRFDSMEEVKETLRNLEEMGYVKLLSRQPGRKEPRYTHLLSGLLDIQEHQGPETTVPSIAPAQPDDADDKQVASLEKDLRKLRQDFEELKQEFLRFKEQF